MKSASVAPCAIYVSPISPGRPRIFDPPTAATPGAALAASDAGLVGGDVSVAEAYDRVVLENAVGVFTRRSEAGDRDWSGSI